MTPEEEELLKEIEDQLSSIDLTKPIYTSTGNQCYVRGRFAGYSIRNLVEAWCKLTGNKVKWISDNYN